MTNNSNKVNIAMLASGTGSNVLNFINYFRIHSRIKIALVISNKPDAQVLKKAEMLNVPSVYIEKAKWNDPKYLLDIFKKHNIDFIVLAGFLSLVPAFLIQEYPNKIVNIHPALLPKFGGKGMYGMNVHKAVIDSKEDKSGISIHYVNEEYDKGRIIFQASLFVSANDTPETLAKKVQKLEHEHYPRVIEGLF